MYQVTIKTFYKRGVDTVRYFSDADAAAELAAKHGVEVETIKSQALKDTDLEQALYCAHYPNTDDALLLECRRELVKRITIDRDAERMQALITELVFEQLGSLYDNANMHTRPHGVSAYDENGHGVTITIPMPHVGWAAD